jgi:hypothetical protein
MLAVMMFGENAGALDLVRVEDQPSSRSAFSQFNAQFIGPPTTLLHRPAALGHCHSRARTTPQQAAGSKRARAQV